MTNSTTSRGTSGIAWPGLLVLLGSLCAYWLAQNDLTTSRPELSSNLQVPPPVGPSAIDATSSRMWEDPITTTYEHWKSTQPGPLPDHPVSRYFEIHRREQQSQSKPAALKEMFANLAEKYDGGQTLCLPVLVNGGANAEDVESRLRTRYALITALAHAGYKLSFPEKMSYAEVTTEVMALSEGDDWTSRTFIIPVKLYRRTEHTDQLPAAENEQKGDDGLTESASASLSGAAAAERAGQANADQQILVLWINEAQLGLRPLWALNELMEKMFGNVKQYQRLKFRILGPASSDTLKTMYDELSWCYDEEQQQYLGRFKTYCNLWRMRGKGLFLGKQPFIQILSPRATATKLLGDAETAREREPIPSVGYFNVIRTIGNDHLLVSHAIKPELETRGAWPDAGRKEVLVLLTEQNTSYGRRIVGEFELEFEPMVEAKPDSGDRATHPLRVFKYFRGVDGQTAGGTEKQHVSESSKSNRSGELYGLPSPEHTTRLPQGKSQYDYLRRLKTDLQRLEERQRITAIGVVGSDVYDKLLVLRALRPHFPDAVFFTTDLDAIYAHPEELRHTRNLVIASHYGLRLNSDFHDDLSSHPIAKASMMPFRDSYQTAEHLAARIAIGDETIRNALEQTVLPEDRSKNVFNMALKLWDHEHDHFAHKHRPANSHLKGALRPLVTTVGNFGFRQLENPVRAPGSSASGRHDRPSEAEARSQDAHAKGTHPHDVPEDEALADATQSAVPQEDAQEKDASHDGDDTRRSLQPAPDKLARSLRAPLTVSLIVVGIVCFVVWDHRQTIAEILQGTSPAGTENFPPEIRKLQMRFLNLILLVTVLLLGWAGISGMFGLEQFVLDGTSVMPRIVLQILIGLSAALTLIQFSRHICSMWERWIPNTHLRLRESGMLDKVLSDEALPRLTPPVIRILALLACYLSLSVISVLYQPQMIFLLLIVWTIGLSVALIWMKFGNLHSSASARSFFFFFNEDSFQKIFPALALLIGSLAILITVFAVAEYYGDSFFTAGGWTPYFTSRGGFSTWVLDFSSMFFAHVMICVLMTAILFGHEWSRDFSRYLRESSREFDPGNRPNPDDQVDSLILIGDATVATTKYTPWLLAYILALLLSYHPTISPVPIPTSLLIVLSLSIGLLVASTFYVRRVIQQHRAEVLQDLRGSLFHVRHETERGKQQKARTERIRRRWLISTYH